MSLKLVGIITVIYSHQPGNTRSAVPDKTEQVDYELQSEKQVDIQPVLYSAGLSARF